MATYVPPKRATAFVFYVGLVSQADGTQLQANPTLAAGDVKIAKDDGAPANLATLPVVDADFTKRVKVSLSATEMDADQVTIIFADAAGTEWADLMINIQTVARQNDDLAYPATSGRSLDVDANGKVVLQGVTHAGAVIPTVSTLTGHTAQTGDAFARLGAPAGASVSADVAAVKAQTGAIETDTQDIQTRLPAALVSGRIDASVGAMEAAVITSSVFALDAIDAAALKADALAEIVDKLLGRNIAGGSDGGRTVTDSLRRLRNRVGLAAGVLTVYQEDDSAEAWSADATLGDREPVTDIDPA